MKQILSVLIVSMYLVSAAAFLIGLCIFAKKSRKTEWEAAVKSVKVGCAALTARCRRSPEPYLAVAQGDEDAATSLRADAVALLVSGSVVRPTCPYLTP